MNKNIQIEKIVQVYLNKDSTQKELLNATGDLTGVFENFSSISASYNFSQGEEYQNTSLESGMAISSWGAATCVNQYIRTTKFLRGVYVAINDLLEKFKDEKIHLLYAGTGPYATLVSPLLHLFDPNRLEITFLDIHQKSLDSVKDILAGLGLSAFAKEYICGDASNYKCSSKTHMIVTETMGYALEHEPQVNITLNLLPQIYDGGIFIPESVNVYLQSLPKDIDKDIVLSDDKKDMQYLAQIINLNSKKQWSRDNFIITPYVELDEDIKDGDSLYFSTQIEIYKDHILNKNESALNWPVPLFFSEKILKGDILEFSFEFERKPEILYKHISNNTKNKIN